MDDYIIEKFRLISCLWFSIKSSSFTNKLEILSIPIILNNVKISEGILKIPISLSFAICLIIFIKSIVQSCTYCKSIAIFLDSFSIFLKSLVDIVIIVFQTFYNSYVEKDIFLFSLCEQNRILYKDWKAVKHCIELEDVIHLLSYYGAFLLLSLLVIQRKE